MVTVWSFAFILFFVIDLAAVPFGRLKAPSHCTTGLSTFETP
jgi:hypothetical protein